MGSFYSNVFTVLYLSIIAFVVLDLNRNDFDKSVTANYLKRVGALPYINKWSLAVKHSAVYKQHVLPNWNSLLRFFRPYFLSCRNYLGKLNTWSSKEFVKMIDYIDSTVIPVVKDYWARYTVLFQKHFQRILAIISEYLLIANDWLSKNVFAKLPQEEMQKAFVNFVASTQKVMINSYEWASGQLQKFMA